MRPTMAIGTAVLVVTSLALATGPVTAQSGSGKPPQYLACCSSGDGVVSPAVVASWIAVGNGDNRTLELLVLWRGTPGWFFKGNMQSGGGGGDSSRRVSQRLSYGGIYMTVSFDGDTRATRVQDRDVQLNGDNVVLVDDIDAPGGPKIVGTKKIDPEFPGPPVIIGIIKRAPELHPFLRCDARLPIPGQQAAVDGMCGLIIPR